MASPAGLGSLGYLDQGFTGSPAGTTIATVREAIYARMVEFWAAASRTETVTYEPSAYTPPTGAWARLFVRFIPRVQETLGKEGNRKFEGRGRIFVDHFDVVDYEPVAAASKGTALVDAMAQQTIEIFEAVRFSGVITFAAEPRDIPSDGRLFGMRVTVPFQYHQTR